MTLEKELTGEVNEYGEIKAPSVVGVRCAAFVVITRERTWIFVFGRDFAAAWTCVNNCTGTIPRPGPWAEQIPAYTEPIGAAVASL